MDPTELLTLIETPAGRIALTAWAINAVVRLLKEDTRILPTVPAAHRRALAYGLGLVAGAVQMVATGAPWSTAVKVALLSPLVAILGHHLVVDKLRGGRELPVPQALKARTLPTSTIISLLFLVGCGGSQRQACYGVAETKFAASVAACPGAWEDCPEREAILAELKKDQEACP